ncbi:hypothetical protein [Streptomyces sp. NBC_00690]|uniref:hypothetical protein n=1 Tax=Streptomyces sp. NBC_00690 TaxID=2975808 RepID=UPI002E2D6CA4|nr:hypothetical protein [Streptomyces sp. NBC_00690]
MAKKDPIYQRYMAAADADSTHAKNCKNCVGSRRCGAGQQLWTAFEKAQDAHQQRPWSERCR